MPLLVNSELNSSRAHKILDNIRSHIKISGGWKKRSQTQRDPSGTSVLSITIRNQGLDGQPATEKTVYNWRSAWEYVDKAMWPRRQTQVYVTDLPGGQRPSRYRGRWLIDFLPQKNK
jgi:hypothetical protein